MEGADSDGRPGHRPAKGGAQQQVAVMCNAARGVYDTARQTVEMEGGQRVSPTEFERLAGKSSSKKWKSSIRVDKVCYFCTPGAPPLHSCASIVSCFQSRDIEE